MPAVAPTAVSKLTVASLAAGGLVGAFQSTNKMTVDFHEYVYISKYYR
jgi:hypothetical protein